MGLEIISKMFYYIGKRRRKVVFNMTGYEMAEKVLKDARDGKIPIDLEKICEDNNIEIIYESLDELEKDYERPISGVMFINNDGEKFIVVNQKDTYARQRFTIAHELGHYFYHMKDRQSANESIISFRGERNKMERDSNRFAADLIMQINLVMDEHNTALFPTASYLADRFSVSASAMEIRLKELGLGYIGL
jgi:Zn-dependent peptidase ImmA (M78 family)